MYDGSKRENNSNPNNGHIVNENVYNLIVEIGDAVYDFKEVFVKTSHNIYILLKKRGCFGWSGNSIIHLMNIDESNHRQFD